MENRSGIRPKGRAVLVQLYETEKQGLIELPASIRERSSMAEQRAIMVEKGPLAWKDEGLDRALPGEKVLISRYAGYLARGVKDGKIYRVVNENDIFCGIEDDSKTAFEELAKVA